MIPYVTGTCHTIIGKGNGGDASSFHLLSLQKPSRRREGRFLWLSVALLSSTPRRRLLSSRKEKCDVSIDGSARGRMTVIWMESLSWWLSSAMSQTVGLVDEGKRRSDNWWLSETQINAAEC